VQVTTSGDDVRLVVRDDGQGFDPAAEPPYGHLGLRSLRDLVEETGGSLEVTSAPNRGTTLEVRLACR
jgi:signal transduction histidine kinase